VRKSTEKIVTRYTNILRRRFEISIVNEHRETMQKSLRREVRGQKAFAKGVYDC